MTEHIEINIEKLTQQLTEISPWPWGFTKTAGGEYWVTSPDDSDHEHREDYEPIFESSGTIPQFRIDAEFIANAPFIISKLLDVSTSPTKYEFAGIINRLACMILDGDLDVDYANDAIAKAVPYLGLVNETAPRAAEVQTMNSHELAWKVIDHWITEAGSKEELISEAGNLDDLSLSIVEAIESEKLTEADGIIFVSSKVDEFLF